MNCIARITLGALFALQVMHVFAATGNLFNVMTSGADLSQTVSFTLCLTINGKYPLSCQNYTTSKATLTIKTTASNHTYHNAGIKINTLGYRYTAQGLQASPLTQLTGEAFAEGYTRIGTVSDNYAATGTVSLVGATAALSVSRTNLALSISGLTLNGQPSGQPRTITISNTGDATASGLAITYPSWPTLTSASSDCGSILEAGSQCTITVTPNTTPSSNCSITGIAPTPGIITISANGVTPVTSHVVVLTYGCIYQGGYIFAMTETADTSVSIGGSVVTQTDQVPFLAGVVWSSNGEGSAFANVSYDIIPGIAETSTTGSSVPTYNAAQSSYNATYVNQSSYPFPSLESFHACHGSTDGACNSRNILALYDATYSNTNYITTHYSMACDPTQGGSGGCTLASGKTTPTYYAARLCSIPISGYSDWYLPAICEWGPESSSSGCVSGVQNIANQLPSLVGTSCTYGANCLIGSYWSSTIAALSPSLHAWYQAFFPAGSGIFQGTDTKSDVVLGVRCVRALTL